MARQRWTIALSMVALMTADATAGQITSLFGTGGAATATINTNNTINNVEVNNWLANGTQSVNFQTVSKVFTAVGPFDMTFNVIASKGLTSYFFDETVTNNTKVTWTDFQFVLGTGGLAFANNPFVPYPTLLDAPVTFDPTFAPFGSMKLASSNFGSATFVAPAAIANGQTGTFKIQIVVRDDNAPYTFTIRETPSVPEPSSVVLFGVGLVGMCGGRYYIARRRTNAA
jgi:hypothetical protein